MTSHQSPVSSASPAGVPGSESTSASTGTVAILFQPTAPSLPLRSLPKSFGSHIQGATNTSAGACGVTGLRLRAKSGAGSGSGSTGSLSLFGPSLSLASSSSSSSHVRPSRPGTPSSSSHGRHNGSPPATATDKKELHPAVGKRATKPAANGTKQAPAQVQTNLHMFQTTPVLPSSSSAASTSTPSASITNAPPGGRSYSMSSIPICFPFAAYPSQLQMMSKIITALNNRQNALLESPTGSGKSLAILCATLAWRQHEAVARQQRYEKAMAEWEVEMKEWSERCKREKAERIKVKKEEKERERERERERRQAMAGGIKRERVKMEGVSDDSDDDDFISSTTTIVKAPASKSKAQNPALASAWDATVLLPTAATTSLDAKPASTHTDDTTTTTTTGAPPVRPTLTPLPKIYLASRTHKQLAQLVSELSATNTYRPRMSVLGSRQQYCIHSQVCASSDRNAACSEAVDKGDCRYYDGARALKLAVTRGKLGDVWDVEDLRTAGLKQRGCPYFAARALAEEAELVLCPYNYLMDASIRGAMGIDLDGAVVVVDEAHNVEDVARDAASLEVDNVALAQWEKELKDLVKFFEQDITDEDMAGLYSNGVPEYRVLMEMVEALRAFVGEVAGSGWQSVDFERKVNVINPDVLIRHFATCNITSDHTLPRLHTILQAVGQAQLEHRDNKMIQTVSEPTYRGLSQLYVGLSNVMNPKYTQDFHVVVMERVDRGGLGGGGMRGRAGSARGNRRGGGRGGRGSGSIVDLLSTPHASEWHHKFALWCMNPAVTFRPLADSAHSIILTSGTLSPMVTFASELGTDFPIRLEADHIIRPDQSLVGVLTHGLVPSTHPGQPPMHVPLVGDYKGSERLEYQDAVGNALVGIAASVPHGVLVFGPSYAFLEKLVGRWKVTGVWAALERCKGTVMMEPRGGKEGVFDEALKEFYDAVDASRKREEEAAEARAGTEEAMQGCGAVLFGVFRGKVSEGIDFSNHRARAVVCIGIPYPHAKDKQVALKKDFNDRLQHSRGLLSGHEWYNIQAFRALNQALGRCIRHRGDWGALILLDQRLANRQLHKSISKWVQPRLVEWRDTEMAVRELRGFIETRRRADGGDGQVEEEVKRLQIPAPHQPQQPPVIQQQAVANGQSSPLVYQPRPPAHVVSTYQAHPRSSAQSHQPQPPLVYSTRAPPTPHPHSPPRPGSHFPPPTLPHPHQPQTHSPLVPIHQPLLPHSPTRSITHQPHVDIQNFAPRSHPFPSPIPAPAPAPAPALALAPLPATYSTLPHLTGGSFVHGHDPPSKVSAHMPASVFHFAQPLPPPESPASGRNAGEAANRGHVVDLTGDAEDAGDDGWWDMVAKEGQ